MADRIMKVGSVENWLLDQTMPITPQIHRALRERIIRNEFNPGFRISESEIARACHVSRQPVREAFIRLAEEGLVAILPQRGTVISKIDAMAVLDARFLREAIEADIVRIAARDPDPAVVAELRRQLGHQAQLGREDAPDFIRLDERFHRTLAEAAGKAGAWKLIEGLKAQMDRVRFLSLGQFPLDRLIAQHGAIVDALASGNARAAEQAMRGHLREVLSDLPEIVATSPDFFELPVGGLPPAAKLSISGGDLQ